MTRAQGRASRLPRAWLGVVAGCAMILAGCATDGTAASGGFYGGFYDDDPWYWGGCCLDPPDAIGPPPPRPEHPIAKPPPLTPSHPIATPPARPMPAPRPAAMPRGGGGGRR